MQLGLPREEVRFPQNKPLGAGDGGEEGGGGRGGGGEGGDVGGVQEPEGGREGV